MTCYRQKPRHLSDEMGSMRVDQLKAEHVERDIARGVTPDQSVRPRSVIVEPMLAGTTLAAMRSTTT